MSIAARVTGLQCQTRDDPRVGGKRERGRVEAHVFLVFTERVLVKTVVCERGEGV